jgi:hypothetical protein
MRVKYSLSACVDCIAYVANGPSDDTPPTLDAQIARRLGADRHHLVNAGAAGVSDFSWSFCECCGVRLGAARGQLAVLECEAAS